VRLFSLDTGSMCFAPRGGGGADIQKGSPTGYGHSLCPYFPKIQSPLGEDVKSDFQIGT
jgi:hypothetical protein